MSNLPITRKLSFVLELPKEIVLDLPKITLLGNEELLIENHKGIMQYSMEFMRVSTKCGMLIIEGQSLILKIITADNIHINGKIYKIWYE